MSNFLPSLNYSNGMFTIEHPTQTYKFSNSFLKKNYPKFYQEDNIKLIYFKLGNNSNKIVYNNGTKKDLESESEFFEEFILLANRIGANYKIELNKSKSDLVTFQKKKVINISPLDLFDTDVTEEKQDELLSYIKEVSPEVVIDKDYFYSKLKQVKLKALKLTDWTQLPDVQETLTEEEKAAWLDFRAALRTIDETDDPKNARLPVPPKDIDWTND